MPKTNAEHQAAWRERQRQAKIEAQNLALENEYLQQRILDLEAELKRASDELVPHCRRHKGQVLTCHLCNRELATEGSDWGA